MNVGDWPVTLGFAAAIVLLVAYLAVSKRDVQKSPTRPEPTGEFTDNGAARRWARRNDGSARRRGVPQL